MEYSESVALAQRLPESLGPLAVDIDGTLTDDSRRLDPRVIPVCRAWPGPLVFATGKSMPYPVALCEFFALEPLVVAENGGVVISGPTDTIRYAGDREAAADVLETYRERGHDDGWPNIDLVNRWRETELAVSTEAPLAPLEAAAEEHGLEVVDTGYAYHVKSPGMSKGRGLDVLADELDRSFEHLAAIGDSENDVSAFERASLGIAVDNADDEATRAADHVTEASHGEGFLEAVELLCDRTA